MTAKEFLNRARKIDLEIRSKVEVLESLEGKLTATYGKNSSAPKCENKQIDIMLKHAEIGEILDRRFKELFAIKRAICELTAKLEETDYIVLIEQRYMLCKTWGEISAFMGYSEDHVKSFLNKKALQTAENYSYLWEDMEEII